MSNVKVGDVRQDLDSGEIYVVTAVYSRYIEDKETIFCDYIFQDGCLISEMLVKLIENDVLLKHYDTFNEAIASEEFRYAK